MLWSIIVGGIIGLIAGSITKVELLCFQVGKLYNYVNQKTIVKNIT